jgi:uncharacterized protein with GYD domain
MAKFVVLLNWTDQGVRNAQDTVTRFEQARDGMQGMGITFDTILWTMGRYDMVAILDAPDAKTVATALAQLAQQGNVRTETLVGFTPDEVRGMMQSAKETAQNRVQTAKETVQDRRGTR